MAEPAPNAEVLRSLGRLVRGLSALFWGLPSALIICFYTARTEGIRSFGIMPPLACAAWLAYGLWQLEGFQKRQRVWRQTLDHAQLLSLINVGLSPFVYWSSQVPANGFFYLMVLVLAFCGLLFLGSLNQVLRRLGAMLPDEALRLEIKQFTALNLNLLAGMLALTLAYAVFVHLLKGLPHWAQRIAAFLGQAGSWYLLPIIPLLLLPLAMTMALLWKTKQVILDSVFGAK